MFHLFLNLKEWFNNSISPGKAPKVLICDRLFAVILKLQLEHIIEFHLLIYPKRIGLKPAAQQMP